MTTNPQTDETARLHDQILTLQAELATVRDLLRSENGRANSAIDRETTAEEHEEEQRLALSQALGLGTGAPWDAIRDRADELAAVSVPAPAPTTQPDPTHGLSVQHADALWDAVAIPGPHEPSFPAQHERVCRTVAEILAVQPAPTDRAAGENEIDRLAQWLWDNCDEDERSGLLADDPRRIATVALHWPELRRIAAAEPVPPVDRCTCRKSVHLEHHRSPVAGCPWCATTQTATQTDGEA